MTTVVYFKKLGRFDQAVVGESNYQEALRKASLNRDQQITAELICENDNKFDPNAVKVIVQKMKVGYLPKEEAKIYREALIALGYSQAIGVSDAKIIGGDNEKSFGIVLDIQILNLQIEKTFQSSENHKKRISAKTVLFSIGIIVFLCLGFLCFGFLLLGLEKY